MHFAESPGDVTRYGLFIKTADDVSRAWIRTSYFEITRQRLARHRSRLGPTCPSPLAVALVFTGRACKNSGEFISSD